MNPSDMSPQELAALYYNTPASEFGPEAQGAEGAYPGDTSASWVQPQQQAAQQTSQQQAARQQAAQQQAAQQQAAAQQRAQAAYQQRAAQEQAAAQQRAAAQAAYQQRAAQEARYRQAIAASPEALGESRRTAPSSPPPVANVAYASWRRGLLVGALAGALAVAGAWYLTSRSRRTD